MKSIGFHEVVEVAQGAMSTTENEGKELLEKIEQGQPFMTTSCCPAYIQLTEKHLPGLKPYVSSTGSPMYYTARIVREKYPDALTVFIGPCIAKRIEGRRDEAVDFVMTFEELGSLFDAYDIDFKAAQPSDPEFESVREAHGFARSGGVTEAVKSYLKLDTEAVKAMQVADINKKSIAMLGAFAKTGKAPANFIEVMACEGGCITGPSSGTTVTDGKRRFDRELLKKDKTY